MWRISKADELTLNPKIVQKIEKGDRNKIFLQLDLKNTKKVFRIKNQKHFFALFSNKKRQLIKSIEFDEYVLFLISVKYLL